MKGLGKAVSGAAIIVFLSCSIVFTQSTGTISLVPGWNLISLPVQPAAPATLTVLSGLPYSVLWAYPSQGWQFFDPTAVQGALTTMPAGPGYWIYVSTGQTLSVSGSSPPYAIPLGVGWNLIGYPGTSCTKAPAAFSSLGNSLQVSWAYTGGAWQVYDPNDSAGSTLSQLCPNTGYWIKVGQSGVNWTVLPAQAGVSVDANGNVQSGVSVAHTAGGQLTLYPGTTIALPSSDGSTTQTPTSKNKLSLSLVNGSLPSTLPKGATPLKSFSLVLTVDGAQHNAFFWPTSTGGGQQQGLEMAVTANNVKAGALGLLFDLSSGKPVLVGSSPFMSLGGGGGRLGDQPDRQALGKPGRLRRLSSDVQSQPYGKLRRRRIGRRLRRGAFGR